jgi:hypothetical protein
MSSKVNNSDRLSCFSSQDLVLNKCRSASRVASCQTDESSGFHRLFVVHIAAQQIAIALASADCCTEIPDAVITVMIDAMTTARFRSKLALLPSHALPLTASLHPSALAHSGLIHHMLPI